MENYIKLFNEINVKFYNKTVKILVYICRLVSKKKFEVDKRIKLNIENKDRTILGMKKRYRSVFCCF